MSLWYDVKNKIYASSPNDNWYISFTNKLCDKLSTALSSRITSHTAGNEERHSANDIDYSEDKTLKETLDEEISLRKDNDTSILSALEKSTREIQDNYISANDTLKQELLKDISELDDAKVDKCNGYSLARFGGIKTVTDPPLGSPSGGRIEKDNPMIMLESGGYRIIPAYTSDLENDANFTNHKEVKLMLPDVKTAIPQKTTTIIITETGESGLPISHPETILVPDVLSKNTVYDIGPQDNTTLILPVAEVGNFIQVDFLSGSTPTVLSVSADSTALISDFDFTPKSNMIYSLFFDYGILGYDTESSSNIYGWRFSYAEYTYAADESEG